MVGAYLIFKYVKEFPKGLFIEETNLIIANFHKDLFMVLRDGRPNYKVDCFKKYISKNILHSKQMENAKNIAISYYNKLKKDSPARYYSDVLKKDTVSCWSYCAD